MRNELTGRFCGRSVGSGVSKFETPASTETCDGCARVRRGAEQAVSGSEDVHRIEDRAGALELGPAEGVRDKHGPRDGLDLDRRPADDPLGGRGAPRPNRAHERGKQNDPDQALTVHRRPIVVVVVAYRSSRTYGSPRLAGAPSRRRAPLAETNTSTTIVITYGSAFVHSSVGPRSDLARLQLRRQRLQRAEEVRADEAELRPPEREDDERDRDPAGAARDPGHPLRRDRERERRARDARERAAGERVRVAVARRR